MADIRLVEIKEKIFADNDRLAAEIRDGLKQKGVFMLNLMASPGGGKTSLIVQTLRGLKDDFRAAVIEGDIDSMVDAEAVSREGVPAVQIRTGGACHLDAVMVDRAIKEWTRTGWTSFLSRTSETWSVQRSSTRGRPGA